MNPNGIRSCYDEGKRCAESLCMDYHRQHGVKVKIIRIFNTYGPRMAVGDGRVVSNFIVQALRNEPLTIYGDGSQTRSFMYIDDLLEGMLRMMATSNDVTGPVNIGNSEEIAVKELARLILEKVHTISSLELCPLPQDDPRIRCPCVVFADSLLRGWKVCHDLSYGISKTISYFKNKLQNEKAK